MFSYLDAPTELVAGSGWPSTKQRPKSMEWEPVTSSSPQDHSLDSSPFIPLGHDSQIYQRSI